MALRLSPVQSITLLLSDMFRASLWSEEKPLKDASGQLLVPSSSAAMKEGGAPSPSTAFQVDGLGGGDFR